MTRRTGTPGYRQMLRVGPAELSWIGSWDAPRYPLLGAWRHGRRCHGFTLRFRGYVLVVEP